MSLFTSLFLLILPLVAVLLGLAIRRFAVRRGWLMPDPGFIGAANFLPASAPAAGGVARIVEATVVGLAAALMLIAWHACGSQMGSSEYPTINHIAFVSLAASGAIAVLAALLGQTGTGIGVMVIAIAGYGMVLAATTPLYRPLPTIPSAVQLTIDLDRTNVKGADLWVNGVYLGKTPYTTTLRDFEAKVPYWPKLPADYEKEWGKVPHYEPRDVSSAFYRPWSRLTRSQYGVLRTATYAGARPPRDGSPGADAATQTAVHHPHPSGEETAYYFAKVRYAGEWGLGGMGGSGGGARTDQGWQLDAPLTVIFPQMERRLKELLKLARLADYRVGPEWFRAAETYNGDAWHAVGKAAREEPRMAEVRDAWAAWHYGLDKAGDAESAWNVFQRICDEAGAQQQYLTDSVAGRAVELLATRLPLDRLIDRAVPLIRNTKHVASMQWQQNGRLQFGCRQRPGTVCLGEGSSLSGSAISPANRSLFPADGFPVAHAIWMLAERSCPADEPRPTVLQERVANEIVRCHYQDFETLPMVAAAYLGGPAVDKFLLRQRWANPPDPFRSADWTYVSSVQVNRWLYLLTYLNDEAGRQYHYEHAWLLMEMADKVLEANPTMWTGAFDFVLLDPWLAKTYWPRFARLIRQKNTYAPLTMQWEYLVHMGDAATADMFVEAWKETDTALNDDWMAMNVLDRTRPSTKRAVVRALIAQVEKGTGPRRQGAVGQQRGDQWKKQTLSMLESHDPRAEAERLFVHLQRGGAAHRESLRQSVSLWLAHTRPDSPLLAMLAKADKPELRRMAMGALREYPTPQNRALLGKLLKDPNAAVRAAAQNISRELERLAADKPVRFSAAIPTNDSR